MFLRGVKFHGRLRMLRVKSGNLNVSHEELAQTLLPESCCDARRVPYNAFSGAEISSLSSSLVGSCTANSSV